MGGSGGGNAGMPGSGPFTGTELALASRVAEAPEALAVGTADAPDAATTCGPDAEDAAAGRPGGNGADTGT